MDNESVEKPQNKGDGFRRKRTDNQQIKQTIAKIEKDLVDSIEPAIIRGLDRSQRSVIQRHFENTQEYRVKFYRDREETVVKVFPIGVLKRLTEQKTQEVLMKGISETLPPMGSFERFIVHDYLKDREGVRTESFGEGRERYVEIQPLFGRSPKKTKRRLTR